MLAIVKHQLLQQQLSELKLAREVSEANGWLRVVVTQRKAIVRAQPQFHVADTCIFVFCKWWISLQASKAIVLSLKNDSD